MNTTHLAPALAEFVRRYKVQPYQAPHLRRRWWAIRERVSRQYRAVTQENKEA